MQGQAFAKQGSTGGAFAAGFFSAAVIAGIAGWLYLESRPMTVEASAAEPAPLFEPEPSEAPTTSAQLLEPEQPSEDKVEQAEPSASPGDDAEKGSLRADLAKARRDAKRYEEGLQRAVAELNKMKRDLAVARRAAATTQRSRPSTSRSRPSAPRSATVTTGVFRTHVSGDQATAMGWVKSYEDESVSGTLYIELFESGTRRLIDSTRESMTLAPSEESRWEYPFQIPLGVSVTVNSTWESG